MSVDAISAVWRYSQAPDITSLCILVAIADWCDGDGYCWPSKRAISFKTGASVATVKRTLREAYARAELERVKVNGHHTPGPREFVGKTGFHATNLYRLTLIDKLGTPKPHVLARNVGRMGVTQTPVCSANGGHAEPGTGVTQSPELGSGSDRPLLYTSDHTSDDTLDQEQAVAAPPPAAPPVENPDDNIGVLTKLAHEVMDLLAEASDVTHGEVVESVKRHAAALHILYNTAVVLKAIDSACWQRHNAGKPSVIPWLADPTKG